MQNIFHLAIPSHDFKLSKSFYGDKLGLQLGRESESFVIINFFNHQVVLHLSPDEIDKAVKMYPRHFGLVIASEEEYLKLLNRAKEHKCEFFKDDFNRWAGKPEEHRSFFLRDPSNNLLEFKWYKNRETIF